MKNHRCEISARAAKPLKVWWPGTELNHSVCLVISMLLIPRSAQSAETALIANPVCVLCAVFDAQSVSLTLHAMPSDQVRRVPDVLCHFRRIRVARAQWNVPWRPTSSFAEVVDSTRDARERKPTCAFARSRIPFQIG